jgi:hypothetical protein
MPKKLRPAVDLMAFKCRTLKVKPCALEMESCELGEGPKKKHETVQLSNNTVKHYIQDLSADTEKQLVSQLISSFACFIET